MYAKLKKKPYGCLRSAILFYWKLAANLTKMGFKINFYDPCVENKLVGGKKTDSLLACGRSQYIPRKQTFREKFHMTTKPTIWQEGFTRKVSPLLGNVFGL